MQIILGGNRNEIGVAIGHDLLLSLHPERVSLALAAISPKLVKISFGAVCIRSRMFLGSRPSRNRRRFYPNHRAQLGVDPLCITHAQRVLHMVVTDKCRQQ